MGTLGPDEEGDYPVAAAADDELREPQDRPDVIDERRLLVFLEARALRTG